MAVKKKKTIKIQFGVLHVQTTSNNAIVTLSDKAGNKVLGGGTGLHGFKGAKQNTPYATEILTKAILADGVKAGLKSMGVVLKGIGLGREGVFKAINDISEVQVEYIADKTPIQYGGCKRKRRKRN